MAIVWILLLLIIVSLQMKNGRTFGLETLRLPMQFLRRLDRPHLAWGYHAVSRAWATASRSARPENGLARYFLAPNCFALSREAGSSCPVMKMVGVTCPERASRSCSSKPDNP